MLRPWMAALALMICALLSLVVFAWSVDFYAPDVVQGFAEASAGLRLEGLAMGLHHEAAEMRRREVRRLRDAGAPAAERTSVRLALADELRDAALLAESEGDLDLATEWMGEAVQAAPERVDLVCLLTDLRTRGGQPEERRVAFLRLVWEHDAACAYMLAGESFLEADDLQTARIYLERAATRAPQWAKPRLMLARIELRANHAEAATEHAREALQLSTDLDAELEAASLLRSTGGDAPAPWEIIARWLWRSYAYVLPSIGAFVLLLLSPGIIRLVQTGVAWVRSQRNMAESAS